MAREYHSRAYHRHFEGYIEKESRGLNGKPFIERVYAGDYYVSAQSAKENVCYRIITGTVNLLTVFLKGTSKINQISNV